MSEHDDEDEKPMTWSVNVPIVGYLSIEVEADSEEAAIRTALEDPRSLTDHLEAGNLMEWEMKRRVTQGNICYAPLNEAEAEEV